MTEPLTQSEWHEWLRTAREDELESQAHDFAGCQSGWDARAELDRRRDDDGGHDV